MKPTSKSERTATASSAVANTSSSAVAASALTSSGDCEVTSRRYQSQVLGITIFGVVGFVVFIKYVVTKYFAELQAIHQQHSEF